MSAKFFTSHIVQIKHVDTVCDAIFCKTSLYIPHSSDKTPKARPSPDRWRAFTSHIVQIKLQTARPLELSDTLYIPHSSDKTYAE